MSTRRVDPDRRERIIYCALELIACQCVAGTSHRKVAALADVPLGSMTYHFSGMDELLEAAFTRFAREVGERFAARLAGGLSGAELVSALVELIHDDVLDSGRCLVLTLELYTLAARNPRFRDITRSWLELSARSLERHMDAPTAHQVDALIEGLPIHRALGTAPPTRKLTAEAVGKILGA
ncbi:TetR family transcriptional regulator [Arthrobacter sp. AQ5-05]|nr:TetR family transcriptional regulator [Arthrobacter sp. AQ5-05]RAX49668.1 TetR family transcriptional regulator [Arthrobacter sp. AQ5-05]